MFQTDRFTARAGRPGDVVQYIGRLPAKPVDLTCMYQLEHEAYRDPAELLFKGDRGQQCETGGPHNHL